VLAGLLELDEDDEDDEELELLELDEDDDELVLPLLALDKAALIAVFTALIVQVAQETVLTLYT